MANYLYEMNKFYDWLETNQLPKSAIAMWYALMQVANRSGWEQRFTVAISIIESRTGFGRSELYKARNVLQQKGRIQWQERPGNQCASYQICFFGAETQKKTPFNPSASVHNTDANGNASGNTNGTQTDTITKPNAFSTKQNDFPVDKSTGSPEKILRQSKTFENPPEPLNTSGAGEKEKRKSCAKKKKEKDRKARYWPAMVETWKQDFIAKFPKDARKFRFTSVDGRNLREILIPLEDAAALDGKEWTETYAIEQFTCFLKAAWQDRWLPRHWSLKNLNSQYDVIIVREQNQAETHTGKPDRTPAPQTLNKSGITQTNKATADEALRMLDLEFQNMYDDDPDYNTI